MIQPLRWLVLGVLVTAGLSTSLFAQDGPSGRGGSRTAKKVERIDFDKVPRTIAKLPALRAEKPLYGLFLFGLHGEKQVWCVLDATKSEPGCYDVLYVDLDADGDLTDAGERFTTEEYDESRSVFQIGDFVDPGLKGATHTEMKLTWTKDSFRYSMLWRGGKRTFGCFGPKKEVYAKLGSSTKDAPIFVPGYDRPLEFDHWLSGKLTAGTSCDFKVFVGQRGSTRGAFSSVDDKFLPQGQAVQATLVYTSAAGKQEQVRVQLKARC